MQIPKCSDCGAQGEQTGRGTWYCPVCDVCPTCNCPNADGFAHYAGCEDAPDDDKSDWEEE